MPFATLGPQRLNGVRVGKTARPHQLLNTVLCRESSMKVVHRQGHKSVTWVARGLSCIRGCMNKDNLLGMDLHDGRAAVQDEKDAAALSFQVAGGKGEEAGAGTGAGRVQAV